MATSGFKHWISLGVIVVAIGPTLGCGNAEPARFQLNMIAMTKNGLSVDQQRRAATALAALFGTPDDPFVLAGVTGLDPAKLRQAAGPVQTDEFGNETGLYRRHCAHCHGISGSGDGPTAQFLNPYPRDYRPGVFKFKSTENPARPTRADLRRTLVEGINGTAMPSFKLLSSSEIDALVEYVIYLSMRGETEALIANAIAQDLWTEDADPQPVLVGDLLTLVSERWQSAEDQVVRPEPKPVIAEADKHAWLAGGRELFYSERAACTKCHGPTALGDGQTTEYNDWNKQVVEFEKDISEPEPPEQKDYVNAPEELQAAQERYQSELALYRQKLAVLPTLLAPRTQRPRNLRLGVYRGGRRPIDVYRRIHAGIPGALMPAGAKQDPSSNVGLTPHEIWQLVDYVSSLPYEPASERPEAWEVLGQQASR